MSKINIVMDTSQYDMFRLCEQRFDYRYNQNKTLPGRVAALDTGTLIHLACETYYESLKSKADYTYAVNAALMKVREAGVINSDLETTEISRIVQVMEEYFDFWRIADQNIEIVGVEVPFIYLLHEDEDLRIHMAGKIDLLYNDNKYTNMPRDHKSYSRAYDVNRLGNQFKNYCTAVGSNYLEVDKIGLHKTLKAEEKFKRVPVSYDPISLEEWKQNVIKVMHHYVQCIANNSWPMNETSCDKFNRRCEYYEVCDASGQPAKLYKLASDYITIEPWDVSEVLRKPSEILDNIKESN